MAEMPPPPRPGARKAKAVKEQPVKAPVPQPVLNPPAADAEPEDRLERLRRQISEFHPDYPPAVVDVLADSFIATKRVRSYCKGCGKSQYVDIPDASASLKAAQELMDRSRGRPTAADGSSGPAVVVRRVFPREVPGSDRDAA